MSGPPSYFPTGDDLQENYKMSGSEVLILRWIFLFYFFLYIAQKQLNQYNTLMENVAY